MKAAILVLLVAVFVVASWSAGETHRQNCLEQHRSSCSVLPWDHGTRASTVAVDPFAGLDPVAKAELCAAQRDTGQTADPRCP